ncbi:MAG TPA: aminoacyl-tRNA hydrolase [Actinomycetota bacterium]|jgi:PTH1 family peptidyl-tRNA hydrolase|nr:aminoacyl-tRNA hydrolase [Actinomycetota bacterium]
MAWLVAGLGNPGDEYARTRHNAGRLALDDLAQRHGARLRKVRFQAAEADDVRIGRETVWLVASTRFMNDAGPTYASLARKHGIEPAHVVALHDEIEIPADELMVKFGGGSAGHNGIKSLAQALGSQAFFRVRIGVGRPPGRQDPADFVLQRVATSAWDDFAVSIARAADAVECLLSEGLEPAQQRFNRGAGRS